ncbi:MAG: O-antigen ligase family protein [Gammaproteobacteria bacterium]
MTGPVRAALAGDGWIFLALAALLVWLPMPWGSRPAAAMAFLGVAAAALALARLALAASGRLPLPELTGAARAALALWLAWVAWIALQMAPLPAPLLSLLSPRAAEAHAAMDALAPDAALNTTSLLPGTTFEHWLLSLALLALFWLVLATTARQRPRQRWLLLALLLSGLGQALYAIVMTLSGWELGAFLEPKTHGLGYATGTFVNKNHFAAYLGLALAAGVALVLADLRPKPWVGWRGALDGLAELALSPRFRVRVALAVIVIALVLTRSRMGNGAFFTALAVCGGTYVLLRHRRFFATSLVLFTSIFVIDLWIVSDRYGLEKLAQRIEETSVETEGRAEVLPEMAPLVRPYALTGSGLGTFAAAYSPARTDRIKQYYNHAHNDHLEFLIEAGVAGYALLAALAGLVLVHGLRVVRRRNDPMACALGFAGGMAVVVAALNGLTDFSLRVPAVSATLVCLAAVALGCSAEPTAGRNADLPSRLE